MMAVLPYALSVHHFISQVGDYVGFAAIVAVAIMVLLLFAHARETAELRRRADDAEDELALLHEQVEWLHDAQQTGGGSPGAVTAGSAGQMPNPVAMPPGSATSAAGGRHTAVGAVAGAGAVAGTGAVAGAGAVAAGAALATGAGTASATRAGTVAPVPAPASAARGRAAVFGAPLGVGAPALSSATKLIPPTDEELRAVAAEAARGAARGGAVAAPPAPPPATAAAGANGKPPRRPGMAADPGAPGGGGRPAYPAVVTSPRRNYGAGDERSGRRRIRPALVAAVGLLVAAIVVVVVLVLSGGSSHHSNKTAAAAGQTSAAAKARARAKARNAAQAKAKGATVKINPQMVTVAVLNGTTTANLAAAVSDKLSSKGFQQGATGNAAVQTMPTTIVGYVPGAPGAKNDAYAVALALGLKPTAVKPVSTASQSVACSGTPTNCPDQVIVTVGADLNSDAA